MEDLRERMQEAYREAKTEYDAQVALPEEERNFEAYRAIMDRLKVLMEEEINVVVKRT